MAQVSRLLRETVLRCSPPAYRERLLRTSPNWRKACPPGRSFVFDAYLGDVRVNVDTRFKVERIMWTGVYEPGLFRLLPDLVPAGGMCLDVGANVGAISLMLARRVGTGGRVVAFEPAPPNLLRLRANLELNPQLAARIEVHARGVGAHPDTLYWREEPGNPGNGMLGATGDLPVPITTLDTCAAELGWQRVDFIKIDVEGMELEVMQGGRELLARHRPTLYFESLARFRRRGDGSDGCSRIHALLGELGYELQYVTSAGLRPVGGRRQSGYTLATARRGS